MNAKTETEPKRVRVHWIDKDGNETIGMEFYPTTGQMKKWVKGWTEHVSVLYNCKPASMFVHEFGRRQWPARNPAATEIYFAASRARGVDPEDKAQEAAELNKLAGGLGVKPENIIYLEDQEGMAKAVGIYGPAVLIEEAPQ